MRNLFAFLLFLSLQSNADDHAYSPCAPWELVQCPKVCIFTKEYRSEWSSPCRTDRPLKEALTSE